MAQCMKEYAPNIRTSDLTLVDISLALDVETQDTDDKAGPSDSAGDGARAQAQPEPPSASAAQRASSAAGEAQHELPATNEDRFLAKAAREHAAGRLDQPLWARAVDRARGDMLLATRIYLQSRATALHVAKRNEMAVRRARVVEALSEVPDRGPVADLSKAPGEATSGEEPRVVRAKSPLSRRRTILIAGALAVVVAVGGSIALWPEGSAPQPLKAGAPVSAVSAEALPSVRPMTSATPTTLGSARQSYSSEEIATTVQALEKEGNWNLVVIYATEWTRKQPGNAVAWIGLSRSYLRLRQFGDALEAATKAIRVAPDDSLAWRNLGQLYVALQRPAEALAAFQQAATLNDLDRVSLAQVGVLGTQLGRFAEARIALDKALVLSPEDTEALCAAASLARKEGRPRDAETMGAKAASLDAACREPDAGESVRVAAGEPTQRGAKAPAVRRPQ